MGRVAGAGLELILAFWLDAAPPAVTPRTYGLFDWLADAVAALAAAGRRRGAAAVSG